MIKYFLYYPIFEIPYNGKHLDEKTITAEVINRRDDLISVFENKEDAISAMNNYANYAQLKDAHGWNKKLWRGKCAFVEENHWDCECSEDDEEFEFYETVCIFTPNRIDISK